MERRANLPDNAAHLKHVPAPPLTPLGAPAAAPGRAGRRTEHAASCSVALLPRAEGRQGIGPQQESQTIELGIQLGASLGLVVVLTLVHGLGLVAISRFLRLDDERLKEQDFNAKAIMLMVGMALSLFSLHLLEIGIFAGFYLGVGALPRLEEALYYSASAYATLGRTADYFPDDWRLIGAIEALVGFLLIGWSTAFIVSNTNKLRP